MTEVTVALIGFAGVCVTAAVAGWRVQVERRFRNLAENEMRLQREALSFAGFLEDWQNTAAEMSALISDTEIDRILILRAWNGSLSPKWTTAVYQMREVGQVPRQYVHLELDNDYVDRLRTIVSSGSLCFRADDIPKSLVRQIYNAEGVTASFWSHIETHRDVKADSAVITYASFSTHTQKEISEATQTRCLILAGRLKGIAAAFGNQ